MSLKTVRRLCWILCASILACVLLRPVFPMIRRILLYIQLALLVALGVLCVGFLRCPYCGGQIHLTGMQHCPTCGKKIEE